MAPASIDLEGKVALVTGAGKGFGAAIARGLAELGAAIAILDVSLEAARGSAEAIASSGAQTLPLAADIADAASVETAVRAAQAAFGRIDILVNNAGIVSATPFLDLDASEWDRVQAVDLSGVVHCCRAVIPLMKRQGGGRIVNIGSVAGARGGGFLGTSAYASAKAGVNGVTAGLARELAPFGITVNGVAPGSMNTAMTQPLRDRPEIFARVLGGIPLGRQGEVENVADAVVFLVSGLAPLISGETLNVDGGVTMK